MARIKALVTLDLLTERVALGDAETWPEDLKCPQCDGRLEVQQPDARRPDRFLGVCQACGAWSVVVLDLETRHVNLAVIPRDIAGL
jgi:hypothetical protein